MTNGTPSANFGTLRAKGFQVEFLSHAKAILEVDFPEAVKELCEIIEGVTIPIEEIIAGGGGDCEGDTTASEGVDESWLAEDGIRCP
jgi:CO dehydrogenase/acetyl-CoA synthase delta subunit